jgi:glycogen phosphorylase
LLQEITARFPGDAGRIARMSIIRENPERHVRMAHLATVGSFSVNGVAALQSRLLAEFTLRDFAEMYPEKFNNKTNGVTPRRFHASGQPPAVRVDRRQDRLRLAQRPGPAT